MANVVTGDYSALLKAVARAQAGQCQKCGQTRVGKPVTKSGGGFGSPSRQTTIFVCGNPKCSHAGK